MASNDIIKLAPTLSAEERFKMMVGDVQKQMAGGLAVFSVAEQRAIMKCENREMWEEYTRHIGIMQWAGTLWIRDIETERLCVLTGSLLLDRTLDRMIADADMQMPESMRESAYGHLKEFTRLFEEQSELFYAYREAVAQLEKKELYGLSLFDEKKREAIAEAYQTIDGLFEMHNHRLQFFSSKPPYKEFMEPIAKNIEVYKVKIPVPKQEVIDKIISDVMGIVDSEIEMLLR